MAKNNGKIHDSKITAELRARGESGTVVRMMDSGQLSRDPATLTSAAAAANDLGRTGKAEQLNKEAYAKSGGKPSQHQKNSFNRTMAEKRKKG